MNKNEILIKLSESERTSFGRIGFTEQSECQKVFSAIWELESQVNIGGFEQFFSNSEPAVVNFAPDALRRIGANRCAEVCGRALMLRDPEADVDLRALDDEFIKYPDDLTELLFEYVSNHRDEFGQFEQV